MSADIFTNLLSSIVVLLAVLAILLTLVRPFVFGLFERRPRRPAARD